MSGQKRGMGIEPEGILEDRAALRFRSVMQEKREHHAQKKAMTFLGTACVFLAMVILVIGVTLVNNYDRMSNMENEICRISENLDHTEGDTELATAVEEENQEAIDNMDEKDAAEQDLAEESSSGQSDEPETSPEESPDTGMVEEPVQEALSQAVQQPEQYTVKTGDTLSRISRQRYGTDTMVREICDANGLEDGDKIYAGQTIVLP